MNHPGSARSANPNDSDLLKTIETSLEDIRAAITCRICVRPLYEPYTIACGHTFCYTCLTEWFKRDPGRRTCPDCRTEVMREPAPSYLVSPFKSYDLEFADCMYPQLREITHIFVNRAELLPSDERTEDHRKAQQDEAKVIEQDKSRGAANGRGPFGGQFRRDGARRIGVIRDDEDGVARCPHCTWEIHDGWCESCGYIAESDFSDDGLDYSDYLSDVDGSALALEEMDMYEEDVDAVGYPDHNGTHPMPPYGEPRSAVQSEHERVLARAERLVVRAAERRLPMAARNYTGPVPRITDADIDDVDEDSAMEQYDSEEDDAGSLEGFIDNDDDERPISPTTSTASQSDPEDLTDPGHDYVQDSRFSPLRTDSFIGDQFYDAEQDDSDEMVNRGTAHNYRHRQQSRRVVPDDGDSSDDSDMVPNVLCRQCGHHHENVQESNSNGGPSPLSPIEIDSDSEPLPVRRARRRRTIVDDESSNDEETPTQSHYSQSSGTLRSGSPSTDPQTGPTHRLTRRPSRLSSTIVIESSPVRTTSAAGRANRARGRRDSPIFDGPNDSLQSSGRGHRSLQNPSERSESSSDEAMPRMEPLYNPHIREGPPSYHHNQLSVPRSPSYGSRRSRTPRQSPSSHSAADGASPSTLRRSALTEERATLKEGRRIRKQERRRRDRVHADTALGGSHQIFGRRWD